MKRKPGKLKVTELRDFQKRNNLKVDGIFGHQTMGMVLDLEIKATTYPSNPIIKQDSRKGWEQQFPIGIVVGGLIVYFAGLLF